MSEYVFAKAQDNKGLIHYLMADTEDEIYDYCDNYRTVPKGGQLDLFDREGLAIAHWANDVTPTMAQRHFTWVGKRRSPYRISRPFDYKKGKTIVRDTF